ncbi:MAG: acetyl-CoA hydrolase/transferase C-terminal domain-containing protein [Pseudomonadales bacterium]
MDFSDVEACVDYAISVLGNELNIATPLGLGKPNQLLNAFYQRAVANPDIKLQILTALSLERPTAQSDIEIRFLKPFTDRVYGDYEELKYVAAQRNGILPDNIRVSEFYIKAGSMKKVLPVQCNYISTNYTFAARDIFSRGANLLVQLVSEQTHNDGSTLSLSCNTDVTLDLLPMMRAENRRVLAIAQVHDELPFMPNKAQVEESYFDAVLRSPSNQKTLFSTPNMSVPIDDYMIGFHASTLVKDGGTLQIGIGSLSDALTYACILRHTNSEAYQRITDSIESNKALLASEGGNSSFEQGLYGCSEMFVNGFMHLLKAGVLKRKVYDDLGIQQLVNSGQLDEPISANINTLLARAGLIAEPPTEEDQEFLNHWGLVAGEKLKHGVVMHGGFFLGPRDFYQALRDLGKDELHTLCMDSVRQINRLDNPKLQSLQRQHARFINTAMMVTLSGAVVSDGLANGQVVSGVGGQYNFVAQAHELPGARSIICVRSTRGSGSSLSSNIVVNYGHTTVPRHLRDIVITEYGAVDLRGKTDSETIKLMLSISDSRFQQELLEQAKTDGKIEPGYQIPDSQSENSPERLQKIYQQYKAEGLFPDYPLGCDFTEEEIALSASLRDVKALLDSPMSALKATIRSILHDADDDEAKPYLHRIGLEHPDTPKELLLQQLLLLELEENGYLKAL